MWCSQPNFHHNGNDCQWFFIIILPSFDGIIKFQINPAPHFISFYAPSEFHFLIPTAASIPLWSFLPHSRKFIDNLFAFKYQRIFNHHWNFGVCFTYKCMLDPDTTNSPLENLGQSTSTFRAQSRSKGGRTGSDEFIKTWDEIKNVQYCKCKLSLIFISSTL